MQAKDVMTANVVTVTPDVAVEEIARLLLERNVSGAPVVDGDGAVLGIVSEGDLMRRPETGTERHRSWWLDFAASSRERAAEYTKSHGTTAGDIMTRDVVTVAENTDMGEIAEILEKRKIKRVPVVRDGKLVGIVSRSNLLQGMVARRRDISQAVSADDHTIRDEVMKTILGQGWVTHGSPNVIVSDGVVELWGYVDSAEERKAMKVAAETVAGVKEVVDHLAMIPPYLREG